MHSWTPSFKNNVGDQFDKCEKCNSLRKTYRIPVVYRDKSLRYSEYISNGSVTYTAPPCKEPETKNPVSVQIDLFNGIDKFGLK